MATDTLKVYANPWLHTDSEGRPCCAVERPEAPSRWVGATLKVKAVGEAITIGTLQGFIGGEPRHDVTWTFSGEPQTVPNDGYYRDRIREGALVLVEEADAKRLGLRVATGKSALAIDPSAPVATKSTTKKGE